VSAAPAVNGHATPVGASGRAEGSVRVGDLDIAYDARGSGEPVLLIPGLSMRRLMWPEELCDTLAGMGLRVIRMDNRDAGDSSRVRARPPNVGAVLGLRVDVPYRLEDMAQDAFGFMRAIGHERFHVAGASMGGMIAQTMAITASASLLSMTSVMSGPGGRRYAVAKVEALRALLTPLPRDREQQIESLVRTFEILAGGGLPFDEPVARRLSEAQVAGGISPAAAARHIGAVLESSNRRRALLSRVRTPTLVIHGSHDPLLPLRGAVATARLIPGAELLVVRGMGHNLPGSALPIVAGAIATHARKALATRPS